MIHLVLHTGRSIATSPITASLSKWLLTAATRMLARSLNMPEGLLHDTGEFVVAYVAAVEQRSALVCPRRVMKELKQQRGELSRR
jgi:hypothetical protein